MKFQLKIVALACSVALLGACGGGGDEENQSTLTNSAPTAKADQIQNILVDAIVTLDGSTSSDPDGDALNYRWTLTSKPAGSTAVLNNATSVMPAFTADVAGAYVASLVVNDGQVDSTAVTVTINATVGNAAPVANAGTAQNVTAGSTITLDGGSSSDANNDVLTYRWTMDSKPAGSTAVLNNATSVMPAFTADVAGVYNVSLVVNDGQADSTAASVTVNAQQENFIGTAYTATNGMSVTLESLTTTDLGNGYTRYTATYKQQNNTLTAIDEATLRLYFSDASAEAQYGSFGRILPGVNFALTRSYSWDVLTSSTPLLLQYHEDHFFASTPISGALQWFFPIR